MPTIIDLSTLTPAQGFVVFGDANYDYAGQSVSSAGDINGDGIDDIIIGAPQGNNGGSDAGEAYVIFGKAGITRTAIDLGTLTAADGFIIQGDVANDVLGFAVSDVGDINGDGIDDIVVGAWGGDNGGSAAGEAYVIFGKAEATRANIDLTTLSAADGFIIQGDVANDNAGRAVSGAGDVNGDGIDDLIIGARGGDDGGINAGEAYVIYGKAGATRANLDLTSLAMSDGFIIQGDSTPDQAGYSVSSAGDFNGDGFDDLIVGAIRDYANGVSSGAAYVIFGKAGGTRGTVDITGLPAADGFRIDGDNDRDYAGSAVSAAGDINGDGFADIIVGANGHDGGGIGHGRAYVIFGGAGATRSNIDLTTFAPSDGFYIQGALASSGIGSAVSAAGDFNGDGIDDLIVGAPQGDNASEDGGQAYIIFGVAGATRANILLPTFTDTDGIILEGHEVAARAGRSVSNVGDVNGDGADDVIIGAVFGDLGGSAAGQSYIVYGTAPAGPVTTAGDDVITNPAGNNAFDGQAGFDQIDMSAFTGPVTLNTAAGTIVSTEGGNDTVTNVEFFTLGSGDDIVTFGDSGFVVRTGLGDDMITGGAGRDLISGGDGDDVLAGGTGAANELGGGDGNDIYLVSVRGDSTIEAVGGGYDEVRTTLGVYQLQANIEALTFTDNAAHGAGIGNALDNAITGGTGRDDLFGRDGGDILTGGTGAANTLVGGAGDDLYVVSVAGDSIIEAAGEGTDEVVTALNVFTLRDNVEVLTFTGTGAFTGIGSNTDNVIYGGDANDFLSGKDGDDKLLGGIGSDILIGGNGADEFAMSFTGTPGVDRILDFTSGTDKLSFDNRIVDQSENFVLVQGAGPQVATTFDATFLYDSSNGRLFYDIDGAGEGAAVLYAILNPGLTLNVGDFIIY